MTTTPERLTWTPAEAGAALGLPERSVQAALKAGELPGLKVLGRWYLPVWGLQEHIAKVSGCPLPSRAALGVPSERPAKLRELRRLIAQVNSLAAELEEG